MISQKLVLIACSRLLLQSNAQLFPIGGADAANPSPAPAKTTTPTNDNPFIIAFPNPFQQTRQSTQPATTQLRPTTTQQSAPQPTQVPKEPVTEPVKNNPVPQQQQDSPQQSIQTGPAQEPVFSSVPTQITPSVSPSVVFKINLDSFNKYPYGYHIK